MTELPTHVQELLNKLASGAHPIELLLAAMPPDEARLLRLCAIPHTFSAPLLPVLDPRLSEAEAPTKYESLAKLAVVQKVADRLALQDDARMYLFRCWLDGASPEFIGVNLRLVEYFRKRVEQLASNILLAEEAQIRMVFHLIGVDESQGIKELEQTSRLLRYRLHWAMLERLLAMADEYVSLLGPASRSALRYHRGKLAADLGQWEEAETEFEAVLACAEAGQDRHLRSRIRLGMAEAARRNWDAAIRNFELALGGIENSAVSSPRRERLVARTLLDIGSAWREKNEFSKATDFIEQGLRLAARSDDVYVEAIAYNCRGRLYAEQDETQLAIADYQRSLELLERTGDTLRTADVLNNLGIEYLKLTRWEESRGFFERSLSIKEQMEDAAGQATVLNNLARLERRAKANTRAIALLTQAARLFEEVHDYFDAAVAVRNLARCHRAIGEIEEFREGIARARALFERAGAMQEIADVDTELKGLKWPRGCTISLAVVFILIIAIIIVVAMTRT